MKDLLQRLEKLLTDVEDCALISKLATDRAKRETFAKLADQLREMATELETVIAAKIAEDKALLEAVLDESCRPLLHGGDHEIRKRIAKRLLQCTRSETTDLADPNPAERRALNRSLIRTTKSML